MRSLRESNFQLSMQIILYSILHTTRYNKTPYYVPFGISVALSLTQPILFKQLTICTCPQNAIPLIMATVWASQNCPSETPCVFIYFVLYYCLQYFLCSCYVQLVQKSFARLYYNDFLRNCRLVS